LQRLQLWRQQGERRTELAPEPPQIADRDTLAHILRKRPWDLDTDAADWVISAGISFLREPLLPPLPKGVI
jgi:hypothetical protein